MADDDLPEMSPSRAAARKLDTRARAILKRAAQGKTLHDIVDDYTLDSLVELRFALASRDPKLRFLAADKLTTLWTRMPPRPALPPERGVTPEEWLARAEAAEQDAAVRAFLVKKGWTAPVPSKEKN